LYVLSGFDRILQLPLLRPWFGFYSIGSHAIDHELCDTPLNGLNGMLQLHLLLDPTIAGADARPYV
jgi:hypothetical protein